MGRTHLLSGCLGARSCAEAVERDKLVAYPVIDIHGFIYFLFSHVVLQAPDHEIQPSPGYIAPSLYTNPELEQILVLSLTGLVFMKNLGQFLGKLRINLQPPYNDPLSTDFGFVRKLGQYLGSFRTNHKSGLKKKNILCCNGLKKK